MGLTPRPPKALEAWLGPRLHLALGLLGGPWRLVADVACDHARLGLAALASGQAERLVASDLAAPPLAAGAQAAWAMASRPDAVGAAWREALGLAAPPEPPAAWPDRTGQGLSLGRARWLVAPGLRHLSQAGPEAIALCGVGGGLAIRLLGQAQAQWGLDGVRRVVVMPHLDAPELLAWAKEQGWRLAGEGTARQKGRLYQAFAWDLEEAR